MAFTKIQPQQLQLPTFTSPSGDLSFTDLSTGVQINLQRSIAGPITITELSVSSAETLLTTPISNSFSSSSIALAGTNNIVSGTSNVLVNGTSTTDFSGTFNTLLNGESVSFGASGRNNTILAGDGVSFDDQITGSVILADHETAVTNSTNHSLLVSFGSGITFENGDVQFNGDDVYLSSHLNVDSSHSGIFSGTLGVTGNSEFAGNVDIGGTLDVAGATVFGDTVTLDDSGDAVSDHWVGTRIIHDTTSEVTDKADDLVGGTPLLKNILTGDIDSEAIVTGHIVTGQDDAYLVFTAPTFTGCIAFSGLYEVI